MLKYMLKRLLMVIPVLFGLAILIFSIMYFVPGDPARIILGSEATEQEVMNLRIEMGLEEPYIIQLGHFLSDTFLHFDFGTSYISKQNVTEQLMLRLPNTLLIGYVGMLLATIVGIPLGILAALNRNNWKDSLISIVAMFGAALPGFWFALVMCMYLSVKWGILPTIADGTFKGYIMAWISVSIGAMASTVRMTRSSMLEVIRQDYITTARAKGEPENRVIWIHALKNALIPIITSIGGGLGHVMGVSLIAETIFSVPGIGVYLTSAINQRDYPIVRGGVLLVGFIFCLTMLAVDLIYAAVDPRLREKMK
ncbi:ABC transporter permease [Eisenbergiella massiliensis]|uniref:ABC transporter permease n=1 Tax=Eisenbergiella massiliensis TaxID=1720294 RepID=A0A3E3I4Q9_9FIRM|nr:ABC transporter permease [Eisenbergiella massiliensis]RGE60259.1 ABC transporter permease [Eisenbergiella massiliensis]